MLNNCSFRRFKNRRFSCVSVHERTAHVPPVVVRTSHKTNTAHSRTPSAYKETSDEWKQFRCISSLIKLLYFSVFACSSGLLSDATYFSCLRARHTISTANDLIKWTHFLSLQLDDFWHAKMTMTSFVGKKTVWCLCAISLLVWFLYVHWTDSPVNVFVVYLWCLSSLTDILYRIWQAIVWFVYETAA